MNEDDRLNLKKLVGNTDAQETTNQIRQVKHSSTIKEQVTILTGLQLRYARLAKSNPVEFDMLCKSKCAFLYKNYTDLFNKIKKRELDLKLLSEFLIVLKDIEDGKIDEHDGSFKVGSILKKIYIDSALNKTDNKKKVKKLNAGKSKNISWGAYKDRFLS